MSYRFLLELAVILLSTKLLGLLARKLKLPQVVGALLAGVIIGPAILLKYSFASKPPKIMPSDKRVAVSSARR